MLRSSARYLGTVLMVWTLLPAAHGQSPGDRDPYRFQVILSRSVLGGGYSTDPYYGYLTGTAAVIESQAMFMVARQQAALLHEQVRAAKLENRRKELEHWAWQREFVITSVARIDEVKQLDRMTRLLREDQPLTLIVSGNILNELLAELQKRPDLSLGASTPIEPEWLPHINFTAGLAGNAGLLKKEKISWPPLLRRRDFTAERERFEENLAQAKQTIGKGKTLDIDDFIEMKKALVALQQKLRTEQKKSGLADPIWSPRMFIEAQRHLNELNETVALLESDDAAFQLRPLQGKTVAEMVHYMKSHGLRFAAATQGGERHYRALYRALADEVSKVP